MKIDKYLKNYVNGQLVPPFSGEYLDNKNPATGEVYAFIPDSDTEDIEKAVEAAEAAFPNWSTCGVKKRFRILSRIADILEQNAEELAIAESIDTGKTITQSRTLDIPKASSNLRFFANAVTHFSSQAFTNEGESVNYSLNQPIGIVACMTPWNSPLQFFTWKVAPALATGNCVIAKPSELAPMTVYLFSKACMEAGLPPGVLNIIHGDGNKTGQQILKHPKVKAISFTGGSKTGEAVAMTAAKGMKKVLLEMSGKNAAIVFADCDFEKTILGVLQSAFHHQGQKSVSTSRILIERSIYEEFKEEFVKRTRFMKVGDPNSVVTNLGPLISEVHLEKVKSYIALAAMEGGTVLCGGEPSELTGKFEKGFFMKPTVIENLESTARTNQKEIFGPVVTLMPFDTEAEAVKYNDCTDFGLSATIWTKDISKAHRVAEQLEVGMVWINSWLERDLRTPYAGVKKSGIGTKGGFEDLRFFTRIKNVCVRY
jgi:aminomuconate-semialdehyde/2-hydroxymuconate-6-semialdehyde dehydrogenase